MQFLIKIKDKKPNPHAGQTVFQVAGRPTTHLYSENELSFDGLLLIGHTDGKFHYYVNPDNNINLNDISCDYEFILEHNYQTVESLSPQPQFLIEYEDAEVKCESCEATFSWRKLESDWFDYGECGRYNDKICPKCWACDCCEIEFEK